MLKMLLMLVTTHQLFTVEVVTVVPFTVETSPAGTQDGAAGSAPPARSQKKCLTMFTSDFCGPCRVWKSTVYPKLVSAGYSVQLYNLDKKAGFDSIRNRGVPAFVVTDYDTGEFLSEVTHGPISLDTAKWMLDGSGSGTVKKQTGEAAKVEQPARFVQWPGWGTIDLETYNRDCDCSMCQSIRVMQRDYRARKTSTVTPDQEGTPDDVVKDMLDSLQLQSGDVVADLGCGDGRVCIAAAKRGFRAIGIEIDPDRAAVARRKVQEAGVAHLVTIEHGDALEFDTTRATVATAYLYPPLLEKLVPKLKKFRRVASPYHSIPGLTMTKVGQVYFTETQP